MAVTAAKDPSIPVDGFLFIWDVNNLFYAKKGTRQLQSVESLMKTKTTLQVNYR